MITSSICLYFYFGAFSRPLSHRQHIGPINITRGFWDKPSQSLLLISLRGIWPRFAAQAPGYLYHTCHCSNLNPFLYRLGWIFFFKGRKRKRTRVTSSQIGLLRVEHHQTPNVTSNLSFYLQITQNTQILLYPAVFNIRLFYFPIKTALLIE